MKKLTVETLVPDHFKFLARDLDGKVFAFENKPNSDYDMWDVDKGEVLQITNPVHLPVEEIGQQLGDWKKSLIDLKV
jgi:hypothetical protein